jgi:predicted MFS family arabinose efflux permease
MKVIVYLILANWYFGINYSLIAPLFPPLALQKGLSEDIIGLILSVYAVATVVITPFTSKLQKLFGRKPLLEKSLIIEVNKI